MEAISENQLGEKFNKFYDAVILRYASDNEALSIMNFVKGLFEKCRQKENEREACFQLITKCEEISNDVNNVAKNIFKPLNDLCQFLIRIRKKTMEVEKQEKLRNRSNSSTSSEVSIKKAVDSSPKINSDTNNGITNKANNSNMSPKTTIKVNNHKDDNVEDIPTSSGISSNGTMSNPKSSNENKNLEASDKHDSNVEEQDDLDEMQDEGDNQYSEKDWKAMDRIKKLDAQLLEWNNKILELETREIDFDDPDFEEKQEHMYEYEARLKKAWLKGKKHLEELMKKYPHLIEQDAKFQKHNERLRFKHTRHPEINAEIEKNLNKKKAREVFPDFVDVQSWVNKVNAEANLNLSSKQAEEIAKDSFEEIGRLLKMRRFREDEFIQTTRLKDIKKYERKLEGKKSDSDSNVSGEAEDPAVSNKELAEKLEANIKKAKEEERKIFEEFTRRQEENVEGEEVEEEEAEEENDEDEDDDSKSSKVSSNESFSSENFNVETQLESENEDDQDENEEMPDDGESAPSVAQQESVKCSPIRELKHSMEASKTPISNSSNGTNGKQVKASPEKMSTKRPIALIQEAYASEKENSSSDSSSDAYNSKKCKTEERPATKRKVMVTQINETVFEKDEIKSPGIYTKKFQSMKSSHVNVSPSRNFTGSNKVKEKSPPLDDCIILD